MNDQQFNRLHKAAKDGHSATDLEGGERRASAPTAAAIAALATSEDDSAAKTRRERAKAIAADRPANGGLNSAEAAIIAALKASTRDLRAMVLESGGVSYYHKRAIVQRHLAGAA